MARIVTAPATDVIAKSYYDDNNITFTGNITSNYTRSSSNRDDVIRVPVVNGFRLPTNYSSIGWTRCTHYVSASMQQYRNDNPSKLYRCSFEGFSPLNKDYTLQSRTMVGTSAKNAAMIQALKVIGDQKWAAGESLAESREAVGMLASSATKLFKAYSAARAKKWNTVAKALNVKPKKLGKHGDDVSSGWLEYHFGWAPVVDDMSQSLIYLSGVDEQTRFDISGHARVKEKVVIREALSDFTLNGGYLQTLTVKGDKLVEYTDEFSCHLYYDVSHQSLRELQRYGLLGLSTPWALVPGSFLVDWVLPIGDFLAALDATIGATFKTGCKTSFQRARDVPDKKLAGVWSRTLPLKNEKCTIELLIPGEAWALKREVLSSPPMPLPIYVKDPLDLWKAVTALSLWKQFK